MKTYIIAAALIVAGQAIVSASSAGEYDGWCMTDDGCAGSIPVAGDQFQTCEQNCTMKNPEKVPGLDATL